MDANTAVATLISKLDIYNDLSEEFIKTMYMYTLSVLSDYERDFFFVRQNSNNPLRENQVNASNYLNAYSTQFFTGVKFVKTFFNFGRQLD